MPDSRELIHRTSLVCPEHGNFAPGRFCLGCIREPLEAEIAQLRRRLTVAENFIPGHQRHMYEEIAKHAR